MKRIFFLLIAFFPVLGYGQFSFQYDTGIPAATGERSLKNPWAGGLNAGQYGTLDMNGDGIADLAVFDRTSNKLNTFLYLEGQYIYHPEYEAFFPGDLNAWMVLADYDCDGKKDIFTNAPFGIKLYRNSGTPGDLSWELVADPIYTEGSSGQVNLQVNSSNMPGITDVDNDGDLDILVFNFAAGGNIEYHQNMALENGGTCEELALKRVNRRWGNFTECTCGVYAYGDNTCAATGGKVKPGRGQQRTWHAGGKAILLLDFNGDGIKDLVFSDELCQNLVLMENKGTRDNALFNEAAGSFPNSTDPARLYTFPAAYLEDVDRDGLKDLIVAPNVFNNILDKMNFTESSWWYKNTGTADRPAFELVQRDFLQDEMIDAGENAVPLFTDYDGDGDTDLFIANKGSLIDNGYYGRIQLWENKGTASAPEFQLLDNDYLAISSLKLTDLKPSFGDLNRDGKPDLVFSAVRENSQKLYALMNNNNNNGLNLRLSELRVLPVPLNMDDTPLAHDVNKDGWADLVISKATGRLEYHSNTGTNTPTFELENSALAGYQDSFTNRGNIPAIGDLNNDGAEELVISTPTGELQVIENFIEATGPETRFTEILYDTLRDLQLPTRFGRHAWPAIAGIYGNGLPSIFIGSAQGGVTPLQNRGENRDGGENGLQVKIFPNPAVAMLYVQPGRDINFEIFDILGQQVTGAIAVRANTRHRIDLRPYRNGVYLLRAKSVAGTITKRFIVQK